MVRIRIALKEPISVEQNITATSEAYTACTEISKFSIPSGHGVVRTVVQGDGDAQVVVRFYVDGVQVTADDTPSNEPSEVNSRFTTSFEIKTHSATSGTFKHSTLNIYGWRK